jgi:hypothetical protein
MPKKNKPNKELLEYNFPLSKCKGHHDAENSASESVYPAHTDVEMLLKMWFCDIFSERLF